MNPTIQSERFSTVNQEAGRFNMLIDNGKRLGKGLLVATGVALAPFAASGEGNEAQADTTNPTISCPYDADPTLCEGQPNGTQIVVTYHDNGDRTTLYDYPETPQNLAYPQGDWKTNRKLVAGPTRQTVHNENSPSTDTDDYESCTVYFPTSQGGGFKTCASYDTDPTPPNSTTGGTGTGGTGTGGTGTTPTPGTTDPNSPTYIDTNTGLTVERSSNRYVRPQEYGISETADHRYKRAWKCVKDASLIAGVVQGGPWPTKFTFVKRADGSVNRNLIRIKGGTNNSRVRTLDFIEYNYGNAKAGYCDDLGIDRRVTVEAKDSRFARRNTVGRRIVNSVVYRTFNTGAEVGNGTWRKGTFRTNFIHRKGHFLYRKYNTSAAGVVYNPVLGQNETIRFSRVAEDQKRVKF